MVNWRITATTIYCNAVDDDVTLMVFKDGSVKCAAYPKYGQPDNKVAARLKDSGKKLGKYLKCEGPLCSCMKDYRDQQFTEDNAS